jgi:spoIIIJ-associated protein
MDMADPQAKAAEDWLKSVLSHCGLPISVSTDPPESALTRLNHFGGHWLTLNSGDLSPEQVDVFLGEQAKVLDGFQYLVNATLNLGQDSASQAAYTVELAGYREERYLALAQMAEDVAAQVRQTGEEVEMSPLPPAERRLIHTLLSESPDLATFSRGQEPQRRLVVGPKTSDGTVLPEG